MRGAAHRGFVTTISAIVTTPPATVQGAESQMLEQVKHVESYAAGQQLGAQATYTRSAAMSRSSEKCGHVAAQKRYAWSGVQHSTTAISSMLLPAMMTAWVRSGEQPLPKLLLHHRWHHG